MKEKKPGLLKTLLGLCIMGAILLVLAVIYPFWFLFAKVVNFIGVKEIRSVDGKLQTPVVFYEHPVTKRIVAFVAAVHIADPTYYATLQKFIDSLGGYKILFEGTNKLSPQEEQALTPKEQSLARQFDFLFGLVQRFGEVMSLQYQKEGLVYGPSWINTDMRLYDLIRLFAEQNITLVGKMEDASDLFASEMRRATVRWLVNKIFSQFVPIAVVLSLIGLFSKDKRMAKRLILDARNEIAFRGISEHLKSGNVVTIWGAAHLRGIEKYLKQAGFKETRREWFTAYTVRNYSLADLLQSMSAAATALNKL